MTIDKRNADFAYLRKNLYKAQTKGLYPAVSFERENPDDLTTSDDIMDVLGSEESTFDIKVITVNGGNTNFNDLGSNSSSNTSLTGIEYECGTFGDDGVKICCDNDQLYKVQHANSNTTSQWTFTDAAPQIAGFDGLYYWYISSGEIYRQLGSGTPTIAFNNVGITPRFVDFYNDQMVIFAEEAGNIVILFWDKSDADLFDKRIIVKNARLIAGGVVNGRLMLVKGIGNSSNIKENEGEIVVCGYDGEKFARLNSIKAGQKDTAYTGINSVGIGSEVMVFAVTDNDGDHNTELYNNHIYKIYEDGAIEVLVLPDEATYGEARVVRVFYNFILFATNGTVSEEPHIYINENTDDDYGDYENFNESVYITNFLNNPYNLHRLEAVEVAFEKLFEQTTADPTGEQLDIYYRVSERDSFTLLGEVTVQKVKENVNANRDQSTEYASDVLGLPEQRYQIDKMPDESALPEYNEIQFKFVSKRGFSVIGAWYKYSYLSRNTFK